MPFPSPRDDAHWSAGRRRWNLLPWCLFFCAVLLVIACSASYARGQGISYGSFDLDSDGNVVSQFTDYDDLHDFNVYFDTIGIDTLPGVQSIDLVYVHWLGDDIENENDRPSPVLRGNSPSPAQRDESTVGVDGGSLRPATTATSGHFAGDVQVEILAPPNKPSAVGIVYGIRTVQLYDYWGVRYSGTILGDSSWGSDVDSSIIGPQLGLVWSETHGRLSVQAQGTAIAGYNFGRTRVYAQMGNELIPGAVNRPLYGRPTENHYSATHGEFCPVGAFRLDGQLGLTEVVSLNAGWTGFVALNVLEAEDQIVHYLPTMGLRTQTGEELFVHNLYCNVTLCY